MSKAEDDIAEVIETLGGVGRIVTNTDGTRTLTLKEPFEYNEQPVHELTFRKPKGKDFKATDKVKGSIASSYLLAACLCGYPDTIFDEMDGDDAMLCSTIANTMGKKLPTGKLSLVT